MKIGLVTHYGKQDEISLKTKNRVTIWSSNLTPGDVSKENSIILKKFTHANVYNSTIYSRQDMEAT